MPDEWDLRSMPCWGRADRATRKCPSMGEVSVHTASSRTRIRLIALHCVPWTRSGGRITTWEWGLGQLCNKMTSGEEGLFSYPSSARCGKSWLHSDIRNSISRRGGSVYVVAAPKTPYEVRREDTEKDFFQAKKCFLGFAFSLSINPFIESNERLL